MITGALRREAGALKLVVLFSWFTFTYVEKPMIIVGRNIANRKPLAVCVVCDDKRGWNANTG